MTYGMIECRLLQEHGGAASRVMFLKCLKNRTFLMTARVCCDIIVRLGQCAGTILVCNVRSFTGDCNLLAAASR
jgi:hypothetical protein